MNGQSYANHGHRPKFWLVTALLAVIGFVLMVLFLLRQPSVITVGLVTLSLALMCSIWMIRQYALRLQNRIIRLEMQTRLARLGRAADADRLTVKQLIALRFASDAEMPTLVDRVLAEKLEPDQIKRAVTNWQGDYLRT